MIKFINWFIRPLGYVCVRQDHLNTKEEKPDMPNVFEVCNKTYNFHFGQEKPEYKDNVVLFDKHV